MEDFDNNSHTVNATVNSVIGRKSNGQFQKGMKRPDNAGRRKGTPNKKTTELIELLGDYNPAESLLEILKSDRVPIDLKIKINLDLMSYIYPKRKSIEAKEQVLLSTNQETIKDIYDYLDI